MRRPLVALAAGTLVALAAVEVGFRVAGVRAPRPEDLDRVFFDAEDIERSLAERNARGFHDRDWDAAKPAGTRRLVVLGDSFTEGAHVPRDELFTERLEAAWSARGERWEVCNVARGGWSTTDELAALEELLSEGLELDALLLVYFVNDATGLDSNPVLVEELARRLSERDGLLNRASRALDWLDWRLRRRRLSATTLRDYRASFFGDAGARAQWERSQAALAELARLARERELPFCVALFPVLANLDGEHGLADVYAEVEACCETLGVPFLSLLDAFRGEDATALWVSPVDAHPGSRANAIAAEALGAFLEREGIGPPAAQSSPR